MRRIAQTLKKGTESLEQVGSLVKDSDNYLWIMRKSSELDGVYQDSMGSVLEYELPILEKIKKISGKKKLFVDIGAHVGYYSVRLSKYFEQTISFEPDPENYKGLRLNMILNDISNLKPINKALWSKSIKTQILGRDAGSFLESVKEVGDQFDETSIKTSNTLETTTLDEILKNFNGNQKLVIKIDTEGAELEILKGAKKVLSSKNEITLFIEHHELVYGLKNRKKELCSYLERFGFSVIEDDEIYGYLILKNEK